MENFKGRHIGPRGKNVSEMLEVVGSDSIDNLINETIPAQIRLKGDLDIPEGISEFEYLRHIDGLAERNQLFRSYIGQGYYGTITPSVIKRNLFENPGWYTAYTPYQAEISQGRLEALLNFQTVCSDLTGMELANGSLLDESTAAAEAMILLFHARSRDEVKSGKVQFFVDENCFTQTIEVLETRSNPLNIELVIGDWKSFKFTEKTFGALLQYPNKVGAVEDYSGFVEAAKQNGARVAVASDLMALIKLKPPGEWGADVVVGNSQRFGVPMGFGGPHAAFFATQEEFKRFIPGRIIGVSQDRNGNRALRMALQTREQHIKRDRATSNICTAQALLANMAGSYAVYHGPEGLKEIASRIHERTNRLACAIENLGYELVNDSWFDTLTIKAEESNVKRIFEDKEINLWYGEGKVTVSLDETVMSDDLADLVTCFAKVKGQNVNIGECSIGIPPSLE